jgi:hydrogenase/urease accessory protein HupE
MGEAVYLLCALTSLGCAFLLVRSYWQSRTKLLLWSSVCFVGLAINNALLFIDLVAVPSVDLSFLRATTGLAAVIALLVGLIWSDVAR